MQLAQSAPPSLPVPVAVQATSQSPAAAVNDFVVGTPPEENVSRSPSPLEEQNEVCKKGAPKLEEVEEESDEEESVDEARRRKKRGARGTRRRGGDEEKRDSTESRERRKSERRTKSPEQTRERRNSKAHEKEVESESADEQGALKEMARMVQGQMDRLQVKLDRERKERRDELTKAIGEALQGIPKMVDSSVKAALKAHNDGLVKELEHRMQKHFAQVPVYALVIFPNFNDVRWLFLVWKLP